MSTWSNVARSKKKVVYRRHGWTALVTIVAEILKDDNAKSEHSITEPLCTARMKKRHLP